MAIVEEAGGSIPVSERYAALAGMIGPVVFALIIMFLTVVQYDFMRELGWHPVESSAVPWPSGLALGPYGWLQVLNFVLFGLMVIAFALGLTRRVSGRTARIGSGLLMLAGGASVLLAFKTDPRALAGDLRTWHGVIHTVAFFLMALFLLLAFLLVGWGLRKDPSWQGYGWYSLATGILSLASLFVPGQIGTYVFLTVTLVWIGVMALRLRSIAEVASARQVPRVG
jgi:hypothetical protein